MPSRALSAARAACGILSIAAAAMALPIAAALYYGEDAALAAFAFPALAALVPSLLFLFAFRRVKLSFSVKSGFAAVALSWLLACVLGALPFCALGALSLIHISEPTR